MKLDLKRWAMCLRMVVGRGMHLRSFATSWYFRHHKKSRQKRIDHKVVSARCHTLATDENARNENAVCQFTARENAVDVTRAQKIDKPIFPMWHSTAAQFYLNHLACKKLRKKSIRFHCSRNIRARGDTFDKKWILDVCTSYVIDIGKYEKSFFIFISVQWI